MVYSCPINQCDECFSTWADIPSGAFPLGALQSFRNFWTFVSIYFLSGLPSQLCLSFRQLNCASLYMYIRFCLDLFWCVSLHTQFLWPSYRIISVHLHTSSNALALGGGDIKARRINARPRGHFRAERHICSGGTAVATETALLIQPRRMTLFNLLHFAG